MFSGRRPPPFWLVLLLGLVEAFTLRWAFGLHGSGDASGAPEPPVFLAFWGLFALVIGWIATGLQAAGHVTLQILAWSVNVLWAFARTIANAGIAVGRALVVAVKSVWDFSKLTYSSVLKPAWLKFWRFIESVQRTLERIFEPVFSFLDRIRTWVLRIYENFVRPILDMIDVARRALRVLSALGIDWARALERKLAELEEKIQLPFTFVLGKINEIVNIVNRVVTADGLFQRLAYIRTLERDMRYAGRAIVNWREHPITKAEFDQTRDKLKPKTIEQLEAEARQHIDGTGGPRSGLITEMVQHWTHQIERR